MFELNRIYHRRTEIHDRFGGQPQGGISTPRSTPAVFVFTSDSGNEYGYHDEMRPDGVFLYTGEGQTGDMRFKVGNKAILEHKEQGKIICVFEYIRSAHVRFVGIAECIGYHNDQRPDKTGAMREAIIFHLLIDSVPNEQKTTDTHFDLDPKSLKKKSLEELRAAALLDANAASSSEAKVKIQLSYYRSEALKQYILALANGICEGCSAPAPFKTRKGPYLECHHLNRVSDGGSNHPVNVVALCPNCHREAHFSLAKTIINRDLKAKAIARERRW